mgnify:CR=1 FL=1
MIFAREGRPFIASALILALLAWGVVAARGGVLWTTIAAIVSILALWVAYFFRDPERSGQRSMLRMAMVVVCDRAGSHGGRDDKNLR